MPLFTPFKKATSADTPDFTGAAYRQGILEQTQEAREQAQKSADMQGAISVGQGLWTEKDAIQDYISKITGGGNSTPDPTEMSKVLRGGNVTDIPLAMDPALTGNTVDALGQLPLAMDPALTGSTLATAAESAIPLAMNPALTGGAEGIAAMEAASVVPEVASAVAPMVEGATAATAAGGASGAAAAMGPVGVAFMLANLLGIL